MFREIIDPINREPIMKILVKGFRVERKSSNYIIKNYIIN